MKIKTPAHTNDTLKHIAAENNNYNEIHQLHRNFIVTHR